MEQPEPTIADNFGIYEEVIGETKHSTTPIVLLPNQQHKDWVLATTALAHTTISERMELISQVRRVRAYGFKFAVQAGYLCQRPLFRFDSDGKPHRNQSPDIPLHEQQVTTPHFHRYNEDGVLIAFKTDELNDPAQSAALCGDANFGLAHFCHVANIRTEEDCYPVLEPENLDLVPPAPIVDPLEGVPFAL